MKRVITLSQIGSVSSNMGSVILAALLFFFGSLTTNAQMEVEPNNDFSAANKITFNKEIEGSFASASDNDYYKVSVSKLQKVTVSLRTTTRAETWGMLQFRSIIRVRV